VKVESSEISTGPARAGVIPVFAVARVIAHVSVKTPALRRELFLVEAEMPLGNKAVEYVRQKDKDYSSPSTHALHLADGVRFVARLFKVLWDHCLVVGHGLTVRGGLGLMGTASWLGGGLLGLYHTTV